MITASGDKKMTDKLDAATGVITVAIGGVTAALTPADAMAWGNTLMALAPLLAIVFLIWRVRVMDKQLQECRAAHQRVAEQLLIAFTALKNPGVAQKLPDAMDVLQGNYDLQDCLGDRCEK